MDIFSWSLPFVAEKVVEMLYHLIKAGDELGGGVDLENEESDLQAEELINRVKSGISMKSKISPASKF